jgi:RNA polymerase sigma-70 factor (ECF subfamily)
MTELNLPTASVTTALREATVPMHRASASTELGHLDHESQVWLSELRAVGSTREAAIARLHDLMLRAARFEVGRRRPSLPDLSSSELDDLALQSADDALVAVLSKLDQFHGRSRFTTWAYKFALLETAVKLRRRPWQEREVPVEPDRWAQLAQGRWSTEIEIEQKELLHSLAEAIQAELSPHQREVLLAVAVGGVPIDVLAERLGTTRGALYKTIHDARGKLRRRLAAEGHEAYSFNQGAPS